MHHHAQLIFVILVEMGFCHVGQADLKLLTSSDLPASASQSVGITDLSHHAQPLLFKTFLNFVMSNPFRQRFKYRSTQKMFQVSVPSRGLEERAEVREGQTHTCGWDLQPAWGE